MQSAGEDVGVVVFITVVGSVRVLRRPDSRCTANENVGGIMEYWGVGGWIHNGVGARRSSLDVWQRKVMIDRRKKKHRTENVKKGHSPTVLVGQSKLNTLHMRHERRRVSDQFHRSITSNQHLHSQFTSDSVLNAILYSHQLSKHTISFRKDNNKKQNQQGQNLHRHRVTEGLAGRSRSNFITSHHFCRRRRINTSSTATTR